MKNCVPVHAGCVVGGLCDRAGGATRGGSRGVGGLRRRLAAAARTGRGGPRVCPRSARTDPEMENPVRGVA